MPGSCNAVPPCQGGFPNQASESLRYSNSIATRYILKSQRHTWRQSSISLAEGTPNHQEQNAWGPDKEHQNATSLANEKAGVLVEIILSTHVTTVRVRYSIGKRCNSQSQPPRCILARVARRPWHTRAIFPAMACYSYSESPLTRRVVTAP